MNVDGAHCTSDVFQLLARLPEMAPIHATRHFSFPFARSKERYGLSSGLFRGHSCCSWCVNVLTGEDGNGDVVGPDDFG